MRGLGFMLASAAIAGCTVVVPGGGPTPSTALAVVAAVEPSAAAASSSPAPAATPKPAASPSTSASPTPSPSPLTVMPYQLRGNGPGKFGPITLPLGFIETRGTLALTREAAASTTEKPTFRPGYRMETAKPDGGTRISGFGQNQIKQERNGDVLTFSAWSEVEQAGVYWVTVEGSPGEWKLTVRQIENPVK